MSNARSSTTEAVEFYLHSLGLPRVDALHVADHHRVSVDFLVDHVHARQLLCWNGRFKDANKFGLEVEEARFRLESHGHPEALEVCDDADVDETDPDLIDNVLTLYSDTFRAPLRHVTRVLEAASEACQGPPDTDVWCFNTSGGFTVTLKAKHDELASPDSYFASGEADVDWADMESALETPFVVFSLACIVEDPNGEEIGSSYLGHCSATYKDEASFKHEVIRHYRKEMTNEALLEARSVHPKALTPRPMERSNNRCHTTPALN